MEPTDLTIEILKSIRDEVRQTNARLDATNTRLDATNTRLDATRADLVVRIDATNGRLDELREELSRRIVESEVRTATAIADLAGTVREMTSVLRAQHDLRPRLEQCERDIGELKRVVGSR